jgi:hypothetical protein
MLPGFPLCRPRHAPARGGRRRRTLALPGARLPTLKPGVTVRYLRATDLPLPPTMKRRSAGRPPPMARPRSEAQRDSMAHPPATVGRRSTAARMAAARRISRWTDRMAAAGLSAQSEAAHVVAARTAAEHRISRWADRMAAEGLTVAAARTAGGRAAITAEVLARGSYGSLRRPAVAVLRWRAPVAGCRFGGRLVTKG